MACLPAILAKGHTFMHMKNTPIGRTISSIYLVGSLLFFAVACSKSSGTATEGEPTELRSRASIDSAWAALGEDEENKDVAAANVFINNPLILQDPYNRASYLQLLPNTKTERRPYANTHSEGTDTLLAVLAEGLDLQLYEKSEDGEVLLLGFKLSNPGIKLQQGISVGMPEAALQSTLKNLLLYSEQLGSSYTTEDPNGSGKLVFICANGKIETIEYEAYVD